MKVFRKGLEWLADILEVWQSKCQKKFQPFPKIRQFVVFLPLLVGAEEVARRGGAKNYSAFLTTRNPKLGYRDSTLL